ncbi:hypothetical protein ACIBQ5_21495 [Streptomyces massasporeus]|uniref:hypothetical protein n=1 Tax=Streptomyces massasporeus TaxID=67324 RepID=UPI0037B4B5CB
MHHVYEFIAHDGRVIRCAEDGGPATTVEGDYVTVYHTDGRRLVATTTASAWTGRTWRPR